MNSKELQVLKGQNLSRYPLKSVQNSSKVQIYYPNLFSKSREGFFGVCVCMYVTKKKKGFQESLSLYFWINKHCLWKSVIPASSLRKIFQRKSKIKPKTMFISMMQLLFYIERDSTKALLVIRRETPLLVLLVFIYIRLYILDFKDS